jgi:hypothetical protein
MTDVVTNRDLYQFIAALLRLHADTSLPLEKYLENLRALGRARRSTASLTLAEFAQMLRAAFESPTVADAPPTAAEGFLEWEACISTQIQDLRDMARAGTLNNDLRYFGVSAPRGAHWFNFDPCTYIECGAAGTFGGWREGDETGRMYVPGPVAVLDASGALTTADPRDLEDPIVDLPAITWSTFQRFLESGQYYE